MRVFVLRYYPPSTPNEGEIISLEDIIGIYASREAAEAKIAAKRREWHGGGDDDDFEIHEWDVEMMPQPQEPRT